MKDTTSVTISIGGKDVIIESGLLAKQAGGSTTVRLGDTVVFTAVTCTDEPREGIDYFPLQVEYREKYYAAGRFPGGYFKREAKPADRETLIARLTDRPIRPLFPEYYRNDVQVNSMLLSADGVNDPDILSITAASVALTLSEIPFQGPIAGVRVGRVDGQFILNPTHEERAKADLDLIYAGTRDKMLMIEGDAKEISEADFLAAMKVGHVEVVKLIDAQLELRRKLGKPDKKIVEPTIDRTVYKAVEAAGEKELTAALLTPGKKSGREDAVKAFKVALKATVLAKIPDMADEQFRSAFDELEIKVVRSLMLDKGQRQDGRGFDDIRPLYAQCGVLPRTHGSAIFQRGETQALCTCTLGSPGDAQSLDAIAGGPDEKRFILHYNFPPYSTGEVGRLGQTSRRELGHGNLAERSLEPMIPEDYPYTVRLVSDIMESNGSSSMASVCAGTLTMMDAGVPIKKPVAGVSIGMVSDATREQLIVDILGSEDHCGDTDFKVAGTADGITGFQVDLKIPGLTWEQLEKILAKSRESRLKILDFMKTVLEAPRAEMSPFAPRIEIRKIDPEKIGELIGPGGKNIRRICETTGAQLDVDDDGTVHISAMGAESMANAIREVEQISAEIEEGATYLGTVVSIKEFGAFVEVLPGKDGLVHISEMADFRVNRVEDICKIGERMWVKCIGIDDRGRVRLSRREAMREKDQKEGAPQADGAQAGEPTEPTEPTAAQPASAEGTPAPAAATPAAGVAEPAKPPMDGWQPGNTAERRPDGDRGNDRGRDRRDGPRSDGPRGDDRRSDGPRRDDRRDGPRGDSRRNDGPRRDDRRDGPRGDSRRSDGPRGNDRRDRRPGDRPAEGRREERPVARTEERRPDGGGEPSKGGGIGGFVKKLFGGEASEPPRRRRT